ncbi:MAG TPA: glycosyltransferase family A protein [Paludibacteraceae bacterium]|jgi:glycosyltransferase involved in cell wall biosynthesis|nr:glycosyltransferase family A protein [Paludibacteraceae bacterium]HOU67272.1 glycosyltransferase family A protein [Paludibacteraceae bacterium]HPH63079.1 glycosyltransferase family A protein [Paludibacteraceae bacterium]HQF49395.1 glycosyltransferase family A protein [Paludibacteraceae bacterium]HQJ90357.1 glycosyltransferase family A protein [Paludibacteraceae bacterium]
MMITVFTPTYNRANTLTRLFESLKQQTDKRFEWLIIDDGSTDETKELVNSFIQENVIDINYIKRENRGLSATINQGVQLAKGDIFFRIDSDDFATLDAIEKIYKNWHLTQKESVCGLVFFKIKTDGFHTGFHPFSSNFETNFFDYRNKHKGVGDRAEVIKTEVMREFPFPKYREEKFCPEGLVWNRMAKKYNAIYIAEDIYVCEYQEGGLTNSVLSNLRKNALGGTNYYAEIFSFKVTPFYYIKNAISFWRYAFYNGNSFLSNMKMLPLLASVIGFVPGVLLSLFDSIRLK